MSLFRHACIRTVFPFSQSLKNMMAIQYSDTKGKLRAVEWHVYIESLHPQLKHHQATTITRGSWNEGMVSMTDIDRRGNVLLLMMVTSLFL